MGQFRAALRAKARRRREHRRRVLLRLGELVGGYIRERLSGSSFVELLFPVVTHVIVDEAQYIPRGEVEHER